MAPVGYLPLFLEDFAYCLKSPMTFKVLPFARRVPVKSEPPNSGADPYVSIGVIAWNEEEAIVPMLDSLFEQSFFVELAKRKLSCEVFCVANGCSDRTAAVAAAAFDRQKHGNAQGDLVTSRVVELAERGKLNAWNHFVHKISARDAKILFFIDADIHLHHRETLWNMLVALEKDLQANVTVDLPRKDISFKSRRSLRERLSLGASEITGSASAQLCAQLYCIRAEIARNIYLPKDLGACEDGFIKHLVCTDFLTHAGVAERIRLAQPAEHTFEAYTSPLAIFKNQKRQIIGQTLIHILVDCYLKELPLPQRLQLAATLKEQDRNDPSWLKRLIREHLQRTRFFWRLYPGLATHRLKSLAKLSPVNRLKCLPAAAAGSLVALLASWMAYRSLKNGSTDYWPRASRLGLNNLEPRNQGA